MIKPTDHLHPGDVIIYRGPELTTGADYKILRNSHRNLVIIDDRGNEWLVPKCDMPNWIVKKSTGDDKLISDINNLINKIIP